MNEFLDKMSQILEKPVTKDTLFREIEDYSSLKGFGILVTLENDYNREMDIDEFLTMSTIGELAAAAGVVD
jgi:acyl carrier protein